MAKTGKNMELPNETAPPKKCLFDRVAEYLDANDWRYTAHQESGYISMECRIAMASVRVVLTVTEGDRLNRILAFSVYPVFVPENRRAAVLAAMNEINFRLVSGCFEMDPADGQIRFRTLMESDADFTDPLLERVLNGYLATADRHFAALMAVMFAVAGQEGANELVTRPEGTTLQ